MVGQYHLAIGIKAPPIATTRQALTFSNDLPSLGYRQTDFGHKEHEGVKRERRPKTAERN